MKIAFTADEPRDLDSVISYHFGHAPYFVLVEIVDGNVIKKVESIENPYAGEHNPGELPAFIHTIGADIIVTGGMGPRAQEFFMQYGIKPIVGAYGKVKDVLKEILKGDYHYHEVSHEHHHEGHGPHPEGDNEEVRRLKLEVQDLRKQIAELKSMILEIKERLGRS